MDDEKLEAVAGALTAHVFLLERLYASALMRNSDPVAACRVASRETMRQFEDLPPRSDQPIVGDGPFRIAQHALHRLERFWIGVENQVQSAVARQKS